MKDKPACFDSMEQFKLWQEAARAAYPGASFICSDCTPEYRDRMVKQNRCAKPLTRFIRVEGELVGKANWTR